MPIESKDIGGEGVAGAPGAPEDHHRGWSVETPGKRLRSSPAVCGGYPQKGGGGRSG